MNGVRSSQLTRGGYGPMLASTYWRMGARCFRERK
jgi:hypothetical protein